MMIVLREINEENFKDIISLKASVKDANFLDSVLYSLAEAWVDKDEKMPFAIYNNTTAVGFVSLYAKDRRGEIINYFIDDRYQGKGYGKQGVDCSIEYLRDNFDIEIVSLPVDLDHTMALNFWSHLGFEKSNSIEDGYVFMRKRVR